MSLTSLGILVVLVVNICVLSAYYVELSKSICFEGTQQSPLDMDPKRAVQEEYAPFTFRGENEILKLNVSLIDNRLVGLVINDGLLTISSGALTFGYNLYCITLQSISEHTIHKNHSPIEIRLYFVKGYLRNKNDTYSFDALVKAAEVHSLVVLTVMVIINDEIEKENDDWSYFVFEASKLKTEPSKIVNLYLKDILPKDLNPYFFYEGSLTEKTCTEGVIWIIFDNPLEMSPPQIGRVSYLFSPIFYRPLIESETRPIKIYGRHNAAMGRGRFNNGILAAVFLVTFGKDLLV